MKLVLDSKAVSNPPSSSTSQWILYVQDRRKISATNLDYRVCRMRTISHRTPPFHFLFSRSEARGQHLPHAQTPSHRGAAGDLQLGRHALHGLWIVSVRSLCIMYSHISRALQTVSRFDLVSFMYGPNQCRKHLFFFSFFFSTVAQSWCCFFLIH